MKKRFKALHTHRLPDSFDHALHGDAPVIDIEEKENLIRITLQLPGFFLSPTKAQVEGKDREFHKVDMTATGFVAESGRPLLPSFGRYVQLPPNTEYELAKVELGEAELTENIVVFPAQNAFTDDPDDNPEFEFDSPFYDKDELYPPEPVVATGPFVFDGYNALLLHIRPLQYNPAKKQLTAYAQITIELEVTRKAELDDTDAYCDPALNREAFGNLMLNPSRFDENRLESSPFADSWPRWRTPHGPELLVIYHEDFEDAAKRLASWKNMRGLITETLDVKEIGAEVDSIKNHIRNRRRTLFSRLRYVILFGDVSHIPSEDIDQASVFGANRTDHYFYTPHDLTHSTEVVLPWISGGRIPVNTLGEANTIVSQIIRYEKNPPTDGDYYRRISLSALFQDSDNMGMKDGRESRAYMSTMEGIREHMVSLGFDVDRIYVSDTDSPEYFNDGTEVPREVKDAIVAHGMANEMVIGATNEGQLIVAHRDHGMKTGWHLPSFTNADVDKLSSREPSVFLSVNCRTGWFDRAGGADSFAETLLKHDGASPSLIAATRDSHTFLNDSLTKAIFDGLWGGMIPTFPDTTSSFPVKRGRLGDLLNYAKTYLPVKHSGQDAFVRDHLEIYHVIGDPTLEVWTAAPRSLSVEANITRIQPKLNIRLEPVPRDAVLTIWHGDEILKRIEPQSRNMSIPIRDLMIQPPAPGSPPEPWSRARIRVCYAAPGHRFASASVRLRQ